MRKLFAVVLTFLALPLLAQQTPPALLVADELYITRDRVLVASGNVEAFQGETRLRAGAIRYDQRTGVLAIEGPITLTDDAGTVIVADAASLDSDLRNGILRGARLVIDEQLQLAAVQIDRVDGRYSQLYKTAVTSCRVCDDGTPPLWQIRAKRVIHDEVEHQLYFDEAQFRIGRIPVFYLPRLRLPDPTVKRATGFLIPSIRSTSQLGVGFKIPYFIKLGDYRDLTITPYLSSSTRTFQLRYRQAFKKGQIQFDGAITRDDLRPSGTRGYVFGAGRFDLPQEFTLDFSIETTSDDAYLKEYGYSFKDRLKSELRVSRVRRDEFIRASLINFKTLRDGEVNATLPTLVLDGEYERRFFPKAISGELRLSLAAHSHRRQSDLSIDGPDPDNIVDGRDVVRLHGKAVYLDGRVFGRLRADWRLGASFNLFDVTQDATTAQTQSEIVPFGALTLRYPLTRLDGAGASQVLEPIAQIAWTGGNRLPLPNDESTRVEFDQGNLLALSRFPRPDRRERLAVAAIAVNWARFDPNGWDAALTLGQVLRQDADPAFSQTSGLAGTTSDLLVAAQIKGLLGLSLTGRGLFAGDFDLSKAELRGDWQFRRGRLGGSYVWLDTDAAEDRLQDVSEVTLDGAFKVNDFWTASADWRFDTASDRAATAGVGLSYENECVTVDLTVDRRYTSSTSVEPSTNIGFNIGLRGFSANSGTERYVRSCSN